MAKEFKDFDDKYRKLQCTLLAGESQALIAARAQTIEGWDYGGEYYIWSNNLIRKAVYESVTADLWQQFRVSLKGYETRIKLARIELRYMLIREPILQHIAAQDFTLADMEIVYEKVRIDNYIGALRRGGQLDASFRIVR